MAWCMAGNAYEVFWPRFDIPRARPAHVGARWTKRFMFGGAAGSCGRGAVGRDLPKRGLDRGALGEHFARVVKTSTDVGADEALWPDDVEALLDLVGAA
jgi:hypothetical protein